jgi:hypothetical protein
MHIHTGSEINRYNFPYIKHIGLLKSMNILPIETCMSVYTYMSVYI